MRVINIDLSSCLLTAPGTVSKKAGHPHPDALLNQPMSWYTGRWSLQLLVGLVQWGITSSTGYIVSSQPNGGTIELTVNTLIFRILLVERMRSGSLSPLLPQNPELPNQLSMYRDDASFSSPAQETAAPAIHYHSSVRSFRPDSVAVAYSTMRKGQKVERYLLLVL